MGSRSRRRKTRRQRQRGGSQQPPPRCQCNEECKRPVKRGDTFCQYHMKHGCPIISKRTGAEPDFDPDKYNKDQAIRHSHNCHAYAMDFINPERVQKCREQNDCRFTQPGFKAGHNSFRGQSGKSCGDIIGRTMSDIPRAYAIDFSKPCEPGYSKIAAVVDEKNDFHYYRQDSNGWWSHKPGARHVTNKDAMGARIWRPDLASRYYPKESPNDTGLNYASSCPYMCVPRDGSIKIGGRRRRTVKQKK
jgi:hypothetical protein